jgi:hypothetical protein
MRIRAKIGLKCLMKRTFLLEAFVQQILKSDQYFNRQGKLSEELDLIKLMREDNIQKNIEDL